MILRQLALAACGACLISTPALAQQAEAAGGPLRLAGITDGHLSFVAGEGPTVRPTRPVDVWEWNFYKNDQTVGNYRLDTAAFRYRIDCQAGTRQNLASEVFNDGVHLVSVAESAPVVTFEPGTAAFMTFRAACEPGFHMPGVATPSHHRVARVLVDRYFAANP
tara:strand:- start:144 stop:635 length:492 start_codon:yes stop_codon:yes gene_type:complete